MKSEEIESKVQQIREEFECGASNSDIIQLLEDWGIALHSVEAEKEPEWISCEERLPVDDDADWIGQVIGLSSVGEMERWEWTDVASCEYDVTHWMPTGLKRPEPPVE